ncbi:AraC family transcriptional regulator [Roseomonas rosulenta]|uniref:AraC family transcriptional regulator n=1 Tax=Roseomonas rosulenta TaxID=2748667 RepID=UPI001E5461F1|nr:AraC family transcriptional regulator [Roseomonas rosulenta]
MTNATLERYLARMRRVLDHIDRHIDDELDAEALSGVAAFSKYHFHRQFTATVGISLHRYVQLVQMKRASYRLAFRDGATVTGVALDAGYQTPEAFARAFRQRFGQAPRDFRCAPDWASWLLALRPLKDARTITMQNVFTPDQVRIVDVPDTMVAVMQHRGDAARLGATIRRFIAWRRAARLTPGTSATFTIFHNPEPARPEDFHVDLCAATRRAIPAGPHGVTPGVIPGGRCAVLRVIGSSDDLGPAATFLYRDWLPSSGEEARDVPLYCQRLTFFPDVPEHEAATDLFLPLR